MNVVLITGSSSGIGQATARRLGEAGWRVYGADRAPGEALPRVTSVQLDVRDEAAVQACVADILAREGHIDALVNNAAYGLAGAIEEISLGEAQAVLDTNFWGMVRLVRALLPHLRERGEGRIVNVSSGAGFTAEPFAAYYTTSKHAMEGFSETLWHELQPFGVHVSLVQPGWARTRIVRDSVFSERPLAAYDPWRRAAVEAATGYLERGMDPAQVARCIEKALTARHPRLRYRVGLDVRSSYWARLLLPASLFHRLVHRYYRLHQPARAPVNTSGKG